jgi:23S rRNA (adenine2030-N6)-methyltransferase
LLSYRHSFHAGNHGDVLKHICQLLLINKLKEKDKGFVYMDTHSGAGKYQLDSEQAAKTNEYQEGIARLSAYQGDETSILAYQALCADYLKLNQYPGSPEIARSLLREQDKLSLMELHNEEIDNLKNNMLKGNKRNSKIAVHHRDGYEGLIAMSPPNPARGMVLIDPSYEVASEYQQVVDTVVKAHKRWAAGIYAIWYPLLASREDGQYASTKAGLSEIMVDKLAQQKFKNLLRIEMCVEGEQQGGMYGTGMLIVNAPWQLDVQLAQCLKELTPLLGRSEQANYSIDWLIKD